MPAFGTNPNVMCYIDDLYVYLRARANDAIGRVRPEKRGLATGTYYTGFDTGVSIGSILLGAISQHLGFAVMWPLAAGCILLEPDPGIRHEKHAGGARMG